MRNARFAEGLHITPVLAPADITNTDVGTQFVDMNMNHHITFLIQFGAMTSDSTDTACVTVEACPIATTTDGTEESIPFHYRLTGAVADDTLGAITAATSGTSGYDVTATDDNKLLIVDVDAEAVAKAASNTGRWVRAFITTNAELASCIVGAIAVLEPRYPQNVPTEST